MKYDEIGCVQIWMKEDAEPFLLHPECYDALRASWMKGEAFYTGHDCYGEPVTLKLAQVVVVSRADASTRAQLRADYQVDKLRDGE